MDEVREINVKEYLFILRKRKWLILAIFFMFIIVGAVYTLRQVRIFEAAVTLEIDVRAPNVLGYDVNEVYDLGEVTYWGYQEYLQTQLRIIRSKAIAQKVIDRLGLEMNMEFLGLAEVKDPEELRNNLKQIDVPAKLTGRIRVEPVKDSRLVLIKVEDTNPEIASLLANTIADVYIEENLNRKLETTRTAINWLSEQLVDLKQSVERSELGLYNFKKDNDILSTSFEDRMALLTDKLKSLSTRLTEIRTDKILLQARIDQIDRMEREDTILDASLDLLHENDIVGTLRQTLLDLETRYSSMSLRYLAQHPEMVELQSQINRTRASLIGEIKNVFRSQRNRFAELEGGEKGLIRALDECQNEAIELSKKEIDYSKLKRESDSNNKMYTLVLKRLKEIDLTGLLKNNNMRIVDRAQRPLAPVRPNVRMNMLFSLLAGLLIGIAAAFFTEYLDNTIKTQDDVEKHLGLSLLGIIPRVKVRDQDADASQRRFASDIYAHTNPKSSLAECIKNVRTNIAFMARGQPMRKLLVTSSGPQEGKTTISTNLAISLAQAGLKTIIIDTDMRKPRIHKVFSLPNDTGLSSAIVGTIDVEQAIQATPVENLWILPCGPIPPNPAELLGTRVFEELVLRLADKFDRLIFDSPPVIAVTDSMVLSGLVDGVVLVMKVAKTERSVAAQARKQLGDVNANIIGVVMNDMDLDKKEYGHYYYYYYHKYGYYYGEKEGSASS